MQMRTLYRHIFEKFSLLVLETNQPVRRNAITVIKFLQENQTGVFLLVWEFSLPKELGMYIN